MSDRAKKTVIVADCEAANAIAELLPNSDVSEIREAAGCETANFLRSLSDFHRRASSYRDDGNYFRILFLFYKDLADVIYRYNRLIIEE